MNNRSKFGDFLYDFFGGIIVIAIILGVLFCCSSHVRSFAYDTYHNLSDKVDTTKVVAPKVKVDSSVVIKKDTASISLQKADTQKFDTIHITKSNDGLFYTKVFVDGIPMNFAIDTGCSDLSMSIVEYLFLEHQGLINEKTNEECESTMANGEVDKGIVTKLDSVRIGNKTITNVTCSVSSKQDAALLLGQGVLSKLGDVTIKYSKGIMLIE